MHSFKKSNISFLIMCESTGNDKLLLQSNLGKKMMLSQRIDKAVAI